MYLSKVFKSNLREITLEDRDKLFSDDITSAILDPSTTSFTIKEMRTVIKNLNPKAPIMISQAIKFYRRY